MRSASGIILAMILALGLLTTWNIFYLRELRSGILQADHHFLGSTRILKTNTERAVGLLEQASTGRRVDLERDVRPLLGMAAGLCRGLMRGEPPESGRFAREIKESVELLFVDVCWRLERVQEWVAAPRSRGAVGLSPEAALGALPNHLVNLVRNAHMGVELIVQQDEQALDRIDGGIVAAFFVGFVGLAFVVLADRKKLESRNVMLMRARDAALESSRLKQAFIANLSHEIRTPLTIILGALDSIEIDDEAGVDTIRRNAGRLTQTVDAIVDLAQIESGGFRVNGAPLRLQPMIEDAVRGLRGFAEGMGLRLECRIAVPDAEVRFDEHSFALILSQLLRNAIKFTQEGGVIVELKREKDGSLALVVSDTGVGMEASFVPFAFDPFSQEDPSHTRAFEGSGLGLALVKAHTTLNGATISVWSKKGKGSAFTIRFSRESEIRPAAALAPAGDSEPALAAVGTKPAAGARGTILAFASEEIAERVAGALEGEHRVLMTRSVKQVFSLLEAHVSDIRLVVGEVGFDDSHDGFGFVRFLRSDPRWQSIPVLMIGEDPGNAARERAILAGATLYAPRSLRPAALIHLIANLLSRFVESPPGAGRGGGTSHRSGTPASSLKLVRAG